MYRDRKIFWFALYLVLSFNQEDNKGNGGGEDHGDNEGVGDGGSDQKDDGGEGVVSSNPSETQEVKNSQPCE